MQRLEVNKKGLGCDRTAGTTDCRRDRKGTEAEIRIEAGTAHTCKPLRKDVLTSMESHHVRPAEEETDISWVRHHLTVPKGSRSDVPKF